MSDHITTRQSTVIPATVTSAAEGRGGRGRRKAATVACAALGALALAGGGFLAGAAVGRDSGPADVAYESVFFGSSSLGLSSGSSSAPGEEGGVKDAPAEAPAGDGVADRSADAADGAESADPAAAPEPEAGTGSGGRTGYAVRGDVIEIEGEDVLVCATGNGFGLSHIGVTLAAGADGDATRAESERLCADAFRVTGALVVGDPGGDLLATERDVRVGDRAYQCRPAAEKVLRCTADDGSMVTLWSAAP